MDSYEGKPLSKHHNTYNLIVKEYYNTNNNNNKNSSTRLQSPLDIHTIVESDEWQKFKQNVLNKHGKLHSAIGIELTLAIKFYNEARELHQQQTTSFSKFDLEHQQFNDKSLRGDTKKRIILIQKKLASLDAYPRLSTNAIKEVINEILGRVDKRTWQKYFEIVCENSVILQTGLHGSILDVTKFVGEVRHFLTKPQLDYTKLAPDPNDLK